jgi:hypothetical protein
MMMRLLLSLLQILFLTRVTSIEHYWVTLGERRGRCFCGDGGWRMASFLAGWAYKKGQPELK